MPCLPQSLSLYSIFLSIFICHVNFNRCIYLFNNFIGTMSHFGALPTWSNEKSVGAKQQAHCSTFIVCVASLCKYHLENAMQWWRQYLYILSPFAMILMQNESTQHETVREKRGKIKYVHRRRSNDANGKKWVESGRRNWNTNISTKWPN